MAELAAAATGAPPAAASGPGARAGRAADVATWRASHLNPGFSLARHLAKTLSVAALILAGGVWLTRGAPSWVWLGLPAFWVVSNFFEWGIHRYPMHRPLFPRILYRNHAIIHHRAFAGAEQEIADRRELSLVMMPWYTLVMVFLMASPVAIVAALVGGPPLAGVFFIGAVMYFLFYETIHTLHHLRSDTLRRLGLGRARWLARLRAHHHHHHQLDRMVHVNFNVTLPLADVVLRTSERPPTGPAA